MFYQTSIIKKVILTYCFIYQSIACRVRSALTYSTQRHELQGCVKSFLCHGTEVKAGSCHTEPAQFYAMNKRTKDRSLRASLVHNEHPFLFDRK